MFHSAWPFYSFLALLPRDFLIVSFRRRCPCSPAEALQGCGEVCRRSRTRGLVPSAPSLMAPRAGRHCEEERWSASQLEPCCGSSESATEQELPHGDVRTGGSSTRAPQEGEALTVLVPEPGQEPEDQQWGGLCRAFRFALPPEAPQPRPPGQSAGGEGLRGGRCLGGRSLFSARRLRWTAESGAGGRAS